MDRPHFVFKPRRMRAELGHLDDAVSVSTNLAGGQACVDRGYGSIGNAKDAADEVSVFHRGFYDDYDGLGGYVLCDAFGAGTE